MGHLEVNLLALLDHLLLAVCPLHILTLHTGLHSAHGAALGPALLALGGDLLLIDDPPGVALLLGHCLAVWPLLDLLQYLNPILPAFLGSEGLLLRGVAPHSLLVPVGVAVVASYQGALGLGNLNADLLSQEML